jgi:hypothetical protein
MDKSELHWIDGKPTYLKLYKVIYRRAYTYRKKHKEYMGVNISDMLGCSIPDMLGCSIPQLQEHLESKWIDGMSWTNYGTDWEIDHIIPLASNKTIEGFVQLNHHTNLQPLWKEVNRKKRDKIL